MTIADSHDPARAPARPAGAGPRPVLYVLLGGAIGTAGREAVSLALPWTSGIPWAIVIVNLLGAFILGWLVSAIASKGPETPARRDLRLFVGTGMMGGFTTYSALAVDAVLLGERDAPLAVGYAVLSVIAGLVAAGLGIAVARAASRPAGAR